MRAGAFIKGCRDARCVAGGHAVPSSATATTAGLVGYRILLLDAADAANQSGWHISRASIAVHDSADRKDRHRSTRGESGPQLARAARVGPRTTRRLSHLPFWNASQRCDLGAARAVSESRNGASCACVLYLAFRLPGHLIRIPSGSNSPFRG